MIPNTLRVPFMYIEFDPSNASQGTAVLKYKALLIGQRLATGTVSTTRIDRLLNKDEAVKFYGIGSMLARMADKWFSSNTSTEVYSVSLPDADESVAATGTFTFTGPASAAGTICVYINGKKIVTAVASADAANAIATAVAAAINAATYLPVTAGANNGVVTVTARNKGTIGNTIDLRLNYNVGETLPAGVGCTISAMANGATDPALADVIALLGDEWYQVIGCPYTDATNMVAIENELASRYAYNRMIDGLYITAKKGSLGTLSSFGNGRNSPHVTCMNAQNVPADTAEIASSYSSVLAYEGENDPNKNLWTVELKNILPPSASERFTSDENNTLLFDGISTFYVDSSSRVRIQRSITMYQKNDAGADDDAYLDTTTMLLDMFLRYDFRSTIIRKYARARLANDGTNIRAGIQVITPKIGLSEAISKFGEWEELGYVEDSDQFKRDLVCQRDPNDPNRLNWLLPPNLVNQFYIGAATIQFRL